MPKSRELHCDDYVGQPYEAVRDTLLSDPRGIFHRATVTSAAHAAGSELRVTVGAIEISAEIEIKVVSNQPALSPLHQPAHTLTLAWSSPRRPGWFPTMAATLTMYALSPTQTQLDFDGTYQPPLGVFGAVVDALALHRFAEASVTGFVREVAGFLRNEISRRHAAGDPTARAGRPSP